ncbi:hypothetical protein DIPPA_20679 [Diplonema papillatum]|nr:hypothetical protein DIPPA_20679 [Diplonema papillatum]
MDADQAKAALKALSDKKGAALDAADVPFEANAPAVLEKKRLFNAWEGREARMRFVAVKYGFELEGTATQWQLCWLLAFTSLNERRLAKMMRAYDAANPEAPARPQVLSLSDSESEAGGGGDSDTDIDEGEAGEMQLEAARAKNELPPAGPRAAGGILVGARALEPERWVPLSPEGSGSGDSGRSGCGSVPATFAEVRQALGSCRDPALRMTILFSWRAAARVGDVVRLRGKDVEIVEEGAKVKWWWTKSDPFHLGAVSAVAMTRRDRAALETLKRDAGPDGTLFPVTTARVARSLKRVNPVLTCHSLRRGACTALFRSGSSLEQVRLVSNHSSIEALLRYLPMGELERVDQAMTLSQRLY